MGTAALRALGTALALGCALVATPVHAHDLGLARVELSEVGVGRYDLRAVATKPFDPERLTPELPARCDALREHMAPMGPYRVEYRTEIDCTDGPLRQDEALRLPWGRSGALVVARFADGVESRKFFQNTEGGPEGAVTISVAELRSAPRSAPEVAVHYVALGVEHILFGWDHLALVLTLCLLASGMALVRLVTAFTIGHSISLSLAVLGWVSVSGPPVEACIALSVAFLAREAVLVRRGVRSSSGGTLAVGAFGLLHGLGFASALSDAGLSTGELFVGLVSFNVGVELGQLVFLAFVLASLRLMRAEVSGAVRWATAYGLGVVGLFWTFERVGGLPF